MERIESSVSPAPADRLLEAIAEPSALQIVRLLAEREQTQVALVNELGIGQPLASRTIKNLRAVGLVESDTPRGPLRLRTADEVRSLLLAANNLADALLTEDARAQRRLSNRTRRSAIRPTHIERRTSGPGRTEPGE